MEKVFNVFGLVIIMGTVLQVRASLITLENALRPSTNSIVLVRK